MTKQTITIEEKLTIPAHACRGVLVKIDGLEHWAEGIIKTIKVGDGPECRRLVLTTSGASYERITERDPGSMLLTYKILHQDFLPITYGIVPKSLR